MRAIKPEHWITVDDLILEDNANRVVRSPSENALVVAGPGAGKTELLAQRACYLLQTNTCKYPQRILAISFKRDAAYNLKERVTLRAGVELSNRFDSFTYDAFAKQLLDRFMSVLPNDYQIGQDYTIIFDKELLEIYKSVSIEYVSVTDKSELISWNTRGKIPYQASSYEEKIRNKAWRKMVDPVNTRLSFAMIMRLAEMIISSNHKLRQYLQKTYAYIFLDEFQDTTDVQYDFLKACFLDSQKVYTAVGDDKQRIMGFAGARKTIFRDFERDFAAETIPLRMNFRSAPVLVKVQNHLVKSLLGKTDFATPSKKWRPDQGECLIWEFSSQDHETSHIVKSVKHWIAHDDINPREICILVKQLPQVYVGKLIEALRADGVNARDESIFQELLTDEMTNYVVHVLCMAFSSNKEAKGIAFNFLSRVHNEFSDAQLIKLEHKLSAFVKSIRTEYNNGDGTELQVSEMIDKVIDFAGYDRIGDSFPVYKNRATLDRSITELKKNFLAYYTSTSDLREALDQFIGKDTIPVMTVHKSKGLEYQTILFVGLEDAAFWKFDTAPDEDKCLFFVALSRAKERVVFTFSKTRESQGRGIQTRKKIEVIFNEMRNAGIPIQGIK